MDPEVQEQEELAATWQAGIDSFEAAGLAVENGVLTAPPIDGLDPSLDPDIIAALQDCIQAVNQQVSGGELALADIGFDGTIGAGQPGSPPVVAAGKENDGGGPGENGGQHA